MCGREREGHTHTTPLSAVVQQQQQLQADAGRLEAEALKSHIVAASHEEF